MSYIKNQYEDYDDYDNDYNGSGEGDYEYQDTYGLAPVGSYNVEDDVVEFLLCLYKAITDRNVNEIHNLYSNVFTQITDTYYKSKPWPDEKIVLQIVGSRECIDEFLILYKELYFRHIYSKCQLTIDQRFDSYANYCQLFNLLLNATEPIPLDLPDQWLWDIIDEFIYQFQSFTLYRMKACAGKLSDVETNHLRDNVTIWNVHSVLNVLHSLVDKSQINEQLTNPNANVNKFGQQTLYKMLGYFSLIGMLRLHSLLGDYYQAIKVLENIDIHRQPFQNLSVGRVLACQMTTFYYVGFAYMMMRRYSDAIRTFTSILIYLQRTRQMYHQFRTFQMDLIDKQTDQMYISLAICLVLHPQRIDESIQSVLQDKCGESMQKMQQADLAEFESAFRFACPKFLSPVANIADPDQAPGVRLEPWKQQLSVFMDEVHQQVPILVIRSFLKLYSTMPLSKLAAFLEIEPAQLRIRLLAYKHKMRNMVWNKTKGISGLEGDFQSGSDIDFYIDKDMIHVADTKVARRYGDYFLRQIHKFEEFYKVINKIRTN